MGNSFFWQKRTGWSGTFQLWLLAFVCSYRQLRLKVFLYRAFPSIDLDWRVKLQKQVSNCPTLSDTRIFGKNMTAQAKTKNQPARLILGEIWHRWRGVVVFKIYSTVNLNLNKKNSICCTSVFRFSRWRPSSRRFRPRLTKLFHRSPECFFREFCSGGCSAGWLAGWLACFFYI